MPLILIGNLLFFELIFWPNFLIGKITLVKSLFDKLLSPFKTTVFLEFISNPKINLASVPELPAFMIVLFLNLNPPSPFP